MKKILLFASALAGLFLAASCQQENLSKGNTVTYTVEAPGTLQTKAIADGMNVNELVYEVWITSANGTTNLDGAQKLYQSTAQMFHEDGKNKATITLDLVNDQHYTVLFWAQVAEAEAYNTDELTAVTYAKGAGEYLANDESLAAFYAVDFVNDGVATNPTVLLKRPFAQVNLCTLNSKDAAQVAGDYNIALVNSKMTLESVPTTFNVATKDVDDYVTMEFDYNAVPGGVDKTIKVNGEEYYYAGMNYVFAGANLTLTYDIQTSLNGSTNYATVNNTISEVPVKENHRTNIVGNLLTSKTDYEIIVDADFAGDKYFHVVPAGTTAVTTADDLKDAIVAGGTAYLFEDVVLEERMDIQPGVDVVLDMNGKTIIVDENSGADYAFIVREGASLVVKGNGVVEVPAATTMFYPAGDLVIEDGTFVRNIPEGYTGTVSSMFTGTKPAGGWEATGVTIYGGYFDSGYFEADAADVEEILAGTKELEETADDIKKRGVSGDKNKTRVALKSIITKSLNRSNNYFKIYGGTFVGVNPAWGDEGCMLPTKPAYLRPWSYYQGAFLDGQTFNEDGIVLPEGYTITTGTHEDGRTTYTVNYNK